MKRFIAIILTALVLCSVLSFGAAAYSDNGKNDLAEAPEGERLKIEESDSTGEENDTVKIEENGTQDADTSELNDEKANTGGAVTDENGNTDEEEKKTVGEKEELPPTDENKEGEAKKNPFEAVFELIKANSDTIFSALTLIGSLVLAFTYKRGLLPALGASIGTIGDSVKRISDATEISIVNSENAIVDIDERIKDIGGLFERLEDRISELNTRLEAVDEERERGEMTRVLLRSQIDMLYDIFMTSSLPQYSKDAVGEKIATMKKLIEKEEG